MGLGKLKTELINFNFMQNIIIQTAKGERKIGPGEPVFIIAEMSGNHNQDIERAYKIIDAAAEAGVDAVKLQTYTADTMTIDCDNEYFQVKVNDAWKGQTLYSLYKKAYTPWEWQPKLKEYGESKGLVVFSTPFDNTAVDFLEKMNVALYKVASFEVVDIPLLKKIGQTKKPVIMSRGMASHEEIETAIMTLKKNGSPQVAVLHCVSSYPAKPEEMNLATIPDLVAKFGVISGLSDHTINSEIAVAAVALGACVIEKHLTLARTDGGPDAAFSIQPEELKDLVGLIRNTEKAIGAPHYGPGKKEIENVNFRKSLFVVKDMEEGEGFTEKNIRSIRPGYGLKPKYYDEVIGKKAVCNIKKGTPLSWELLENNDKSIIRSAKKEDSKRIWEIRNNPQTRKFSNNQSEFPFEQHDIWYQQKYFSEADNHCFVLCDNSEIVIGYCRYDRSEKEEFVVSIAIDSGYQARGMGMLLLANSLNNYDSIFKNKTIIAKCFKNNPASVNLFLKSNFIIYKEDGESLYLKLIN